MACDAPHSPRRSLRRSQGRRTLRCLPKTLGSRLYGSLLRTFGITGGVGPDGITLDAQGKLAVCHFGLGAAWRFSALGEPHHRIQSCAGLKTTNLAYGGAEGRDLDITEADSGAILRARLPTPGQVRFSHK